MALLNHTKREINAKIVFVGPELSGKSTLLQFVYRKLKPELRGKLKSMNLQNDKMVFFDFQPNQQQPINGYSVRFHIYTLTGGLSHQNSWKMVIKGADGIVFVADSSPERITANLEAMQNLAANLEAYDINDIPRILICNKRDITAPLPVADITTALNDDKMQAFPAIATKGEGVLEAVFTLIKSIMKRLPDEVPEVKGDLQKLQSSSSVQDAFIPPKEESLAWPDYEETEISLSNQEEKMVKGAGSVAPLATEVAILGNPELLPDGKTTRISLLFKSGDAVQQLDLNISVNLPANLEK
jgi:signal recognition particle receptor subunit beta